MFKGILAALAVTMVAVPAKADWYEASSDHFVVYADDKEEDIREFVGNLEKFHWAMEFVTRRSVPKPSDSNRVTIFVVGSEAKMRQLAGSRSVAGFYIPRAGASRAFVQDIRDGSGGYPHFSTTVLLHEYAHHFLISGSRFAMPTWLSEGAAEFFASAFFAKDGSVSIGRPALHRKNDFAYSERVSIEALFDPEIYEKERGILYDQFYARSWLLYHYLTFAEERRGQLAQYWEKVRTGVPSLQAGTEAFGDLRKLDRDLRRYLQKRRLLGFDLKPDATRDDNITLRRLPAGEAAAMNLRIVSQRGVSKEEAAKLVEDARELAARYPGDPGVLAALAEAEFDAGNDDRAIQAADQALALDPRQKNALVQKGFALFRKAEDADNKASAYNAAMAPFSALNALETDHPLPLIYLYRSQIKRGVRPSETARHALERASQLAPFDRALTLNTALMLAEEGKIALARTQLEPLMADPHYKKLAETARGHHEQLATVAEGTSWTPGRSLDWEDQQEADDDEEKEGED